MSIIASNNSYPSDPDPTPNKLDRAGYAGNALTLDQKIDANLAEAKALIESFKGSTDLGSITPTSVPTGTGPAFWRATQNGTYTNFGGLVVNVNSFAVISRDATGIFSISQTEMVIPQANNKIITWTATAFSSGEQVNYLGKDWVSNAATVAGDVPGTSVKWEERLNYASKDIVGNSFIDNELLSLNFLLDTGINNDGTIFSKPGYSSVEKFRIKPLSNFNFRCSEYGSGVYIFNESGVKTRTLSNYTAITAGVFAAGETFVAVEINTSQKTNTYFNFIGQYNVIEAIKLMHPSNKEAIDKNVDIVGNKLIYSALNLKFDYTDPIWPIVKIKVKPLSTFKYRRTANITIRTLDATGATLRDFSNNTGTPELATITNTFLEGEVYFYARFVYVDAPNVFFECDGEYALTDHYTVSENKYGLKGTYENFSVAVNYNEEDVISTSPTTLQDATHNYSDNGVIALPTNYVTVGKKTRLVIFCQGTGERISSTTNPMNNFGWDYLLKKGFAVMDMNGMSADWGDSKSFAVVNQHYGNKYLLQSYKKGYDYVIKKYNLFDEVFVIGLSMGGLASFMLTQSNLIPVLAQANFCPVISVFKQAYLQPWFGEPMQKTIAGQWGFTDFNTTTPSQAYFTANLSKIKGYENLLTNTFGNTKDDANSNYNNPAEATAYNALSKIFPVPLKIWHSIDDGLVSIRYSEFMVNMIKNGDGKAWLRKMSTGDHVGGWNNGTINDTDVEGNSVTTSIPMFEAVSFLNRYQ